jgi:hypothetical protein
MILDAHCITRRLHETQGLKLLSADQERENKMWHLKDPEDDKKKWTFDRLLDIGFWIVFAVFACLVATHARPY